MGKLNVRKGKKICLEFTERRKIAFGNREERDGKIKCKEREENMFRIY